LLAATGNPHRSRDTFRLLNAHMRDEKSFGGAPRQGVRPIAQRLDPEMPLRLHLQQRLLCLGRLQPGVMRCAACCQRSGDDRIDVGKAMDYMLTRWDSFSRSISDGRICLTNNAAERALRGIALGRKAWLFAGSDRGGERAAAMYTLIVTAKLNGLDPRAWLADVLCRIADHPASRIDELLPWNCTQRAARLAA